MLLKWSSTKIAKMVLLWWTKWPPVLKIENHELFALKANSSWTLGPMWFKLHRNVSNGQVYSNDEFDLWPVYSGEWFRAFRPSCFLIIIGHSLRDDHIRVVMEHSFLLSVWYPYFLEFCCFFRSRHSPLAHPLTICMAIKAELGHFCSFNTK